MELFWINVGVCAAICGLFTYFLYRQELRTEDMIRRINNKQESLLRDTEEE